MYTGVRSHWLGFLLVFAMENHSSWIKNSQIRRMLLVEKAGDHEVDTARNQQFNVRYGCAFPLTSVDSRGTAPPSCTNGLQAIAAVLLEG
jgi:hypothetical protein